MLCAHFSQRWHGTGRVRAPGFSKQPAPSWRAGSCPLVLSIPQSCYEDETPVFIQIALSRDRLAWGHFTLRERGQRKERSTFGR